MKFAVALYSLDVPTTKEQQAATVSPEGRFEQLAVAAHSIRGCPY